MVSSVWRFAHLALALLSFSFLTIASITGVILAIDVVNEQNKSYKSEDFNDLTLAESITNLREVYPEILELNVDTNHYVTIEGFDEEGNDFDLVAELPKDIRALIQQLKKNLYN